MQFHQQQDKYIIAQQSLLNDYYIYTCMCMHVCVFLGKHINRYIYMCVHMNRCQKSTLDAIIKDPCRYFLYIGLLLESYWNFQLSWTLHHKPHGSVYHSTSIVNIYQDICFLSGCQSSNAGSNVLLTCSLLHKVPPQSWHDLL